MCREKMGGFFWGQLLQPGFAGAQTVLGKVHREHHGWKTPTLSVYHAGATMQ